MSRHLFSLLLILTGVLTQSVMAQTPQQDSVARPQSLRFEGSLTGDSVQQHPLSLLVGGYVRGYVEGDGVQLTLVDGLGAHLRRLSQGRGRRQDFQFTVEASDGLQLQVQAPTSARYAVVLEEICPLTEQFDPPKILDSARLRQLQDHLATGGSTDEFWREMKAQGTPLVESADVLPPLAGQNVLVTFLHRGAKHGVRLFGAPSNDHDDLQRLGESDVWFGSYRVPATTRLDYRLAPDVPRLNASPRVRRRAILATAQRDPFNRHRFPESELPDRFSGASVFVLPDAPPVPELQVQPGVPHGTLERLSVSSQILQNTRDVTLYRPAGYEPGAAGNALLVIFDGERYLTDVPTPVILDNLLAQNDIPPTCAIFVSNPSMDSRATELPCNADFARFLAEELVPWAHQRGVYAEPDHTVVAGASYGGLAAAYVAWRHADVFGNALCQSGSFWWAPRSPAAEGEWLTRQIAESSVRPVRFYLEAGLFEAGRGGAVGILEATQHLRNVLTARGYETRYAEFPGGHGYYQWRFTFPRALKAILNP